MLTVVDDRTGVAVTVGKRPSRLVRLAVLLPPDDHEISGQALRVLLIADLARRVLEGLHGSQVRTTVVGSAVALEQAAERLRALWIVPPDEVRSGLDDPAEHSELVVTAAGERGGEIPGELPVLLAGPTTGHDADDTDPTAVRLAMLNVPRTEPATLDGEQLTAAARRLDRWRAEVAAAARQPSAPIPAAVMTRIRAACDDDLDATGLLQALDEMDDEVPAGARLETLLYVDRIVALDLARGLTAG